MDTILSTYLKTKNDDAVVQIKEATQRDGKYTEPFSIGYREFDQAMMGGVREGDLVVLTGISGHGKTFLAQNITIKLVNQDYACLWFTYEVIIDNVYAKFLEMGIAPDKVKIYTPKRLLSGSLKWIKAKIEESVKMYQTKFIFIDHLDYITPMEDDRKKNSELMRRQIMMELKKLVVDLRITIFLIAHVAKARDKYGKEREIEMQDLGGSAGVFQSPDFVICVRRAYDMVQCPEAGAKMINKSYIRLLKNRLTGELVEQTYQVVDNVICDIPLSANEIIQNVFKGTK